MVTDDIQHHVQDDLCHNVDACDEKKQPLLPEAEKKSDADFQKNRKEDAAGEGQYFPGIGIVPLGCENDALRFGGTGLEIFYID